MQFKVGSGDFLLINYQVQTFKNTKKFLFCPQFAYLVKDRLTRCPCFKKIENFKKELTSLIIYD